MFRVLIRVSKSVRVSVKVCCCQDEAVNTRKVVCNLLHACPWPITGDLRPFVTRSMTTRGPNCGITGFF